MDISPMSLQVKPTAVPLEKLANDPNITPDDKVKEVSRQFEAVLLRQIIAESRKNVLSGEDESSANSIYNDMINNQLADSISKSGSFGLAKSIEHQLAHQVLPGSAAHAKAQMPVK